MLKRCDFRTRRKEGCESISLMLTGIEAIPNVWSADWESATTKLSSSSKNDSRPGCCWPQLTALGSTDAECDEVFKISRGTIMEDIGPKQVTYRNITELISWKCRRWISLITTNEGQMAEQLYRRRAVTSANAFVVLKHAQCNISHAVGHWPCGRRLNKHRQRRIIGWIRAVRASRPRLFWCKSLGDGTLRRCNNKPKLKDMFSRQRVDTDYQLPFGLLRKTNAVLAVFCCAIYTASAFAAVPHL